MNYLRWHLVISLLTMVAWGRVCAAAPDKQQVLKTLRQFDTVYTENGFSVTGTAIEPAYEERRPGQPDVTRNWQMTLQGKKSATIYEAIGPVKGIHFVKPDPSYRGNYDPAGNFLTAVCTKRTVYCDSQRSGMYTENTCYVVSPDNVVQDEGVSRRVIMSGPGLTGAGRYVKEILWAVGRGFSQYLDEITEVKELPDGKLHLVAEGRQSDVYRGRWELVIDTETAWIVRHAKFFHEAYPDTIDFESANSGLTWNGSLAMPEQAAVNYSGPVKQDSRTLKFAFTEISSGPDEELLERARTRIQPPFNRDTTVMLERAGQIMVVDQQIVDSTIDESIRSMTTEAFVDTRPAENVSAAANGESTTLPAVSQQIPSQPRPPRRSQYLLPPWAAYIVLAVALTGVVALVAKRSGIGRRQGRNQ